MSPSIQHVSPSYVIRSLVPKPYGTYILRYSTSDDNIISKIELNSKSEDNVSPDNYIILSVRVDESIYKYYIKSYRLPHMVDKNIDENAEKLLELYNEKRTTSNKNDLTTLTNELILPSEDQDWFLDQRYFCGIDFTRSRRVGMHNQGVSTAIWQSNKQNDVKIFIKRFQKNNFYFRHELSLLKELSHFSIIRLYGQYSDQNFSYLVFENGGQSLESICPLKFQSIKTKMRFIVNVGFQIAHAMMYLEKKNIIHRDLTASNVLLNSFGFIRIADFGHAIKTADRTNAYERSQIISEANQFQFRFLAPECLPCSNKIKTMVPINPTDIYTRFSSKSDVWSFGILLIQLMIKDPCKPYPNISDVNHIPQYVKEEGKIHPQPVGCPLDIYFILRRCWAYEAESRISFAEIRDKMKCLDTIFK